MAIRVMTSPTPSIMGKLVAKLSKNS